MKDKFRTYYPSVSGILSILILSMLFAVINTTTAQSFLYKKGGVAFRIENNPVLSKLHQLDSLFSTHNQKFSLAISSWLFPLAPAYVDSLISYTSKGYEVMDNTPTYRTQYFNLINPADTSLFIGKPGVDHVTAERVCLAYSAVDTSQSHNEGLIDVFGNMVISHNPGEFGNLTGNPYFFALLIGSVNEVCLWYNRSAINPSDPDTLFIQSLWEEPVDFGTLYNLNYHKLTRVNVLMKPEAIRLLGQRSLDLFDQYNIPRPLTWIHPSGQMPMLDGFQVKTTMADYLNFEVGSNYINESYLCYNEYNPYGIKQFGMQNDLISVANHTLAWNKERIANLVAKHYMAVDVSSLEGTMGGWNNYLIRLDSILGWCVQNDIPIGTYTQWKSWLYDSIPIRVVDIFPALNTDIDQNGFPDGYDQGGSITGIYDTTDGVAGSGGRSFMALQEGTVCQITQLAGLEKGDNFFTISLKNIGTDSSMVRATFIFPETGDVQEFEFIADTSIWIQESGIITVPASASILNILIERTDTLYDTLKISGLGFRSSGFLNRSAFPHQEVVQNHQFGPINLYQLVIDTIYNPETITWWVKGADTMNFRDLTSEYMLPLKPNSFWIGSDSAWLMAMSPDSIIDSCWMSFTSHPMEVTCPGLPITIELLDTLENDFIQWTSVPFDSTLSDPTIYNPTVNPSVTTLYKVKAINPQGPIKKDSLLVVMFPIPQLVLTPDTAICLGDSITLTATGGANYLWSTGDTTDSIHIGPRSTRTYDVTAFSSEGCYDTGSVVVTVNPVPNVSLYGLWPAYCAYDNPASVYGVPEGGLFSGTGIFEMMFYPDSATIGANVITYFYSDSIGCANSDTTTVYVYAKPAILQLPTDTLVCADEFITLHAGGGNTSYLWSNGVTDSVAILDTNGVGLGNYMLWVYVTNNGCVNIDTALVNFIDCHPGIEEVSPGQAYRIYPNPAAEYVTIEDLTQNNEEFSVELLDLRGERLIFSSKHLYKTELMLNGISPGVYLLQISGKNGLYHFRLVHQ
ncbi:T9SS type A sorting domain-containing protein [Bacteroidota bacterium]